MKVVAKPETCINVRITLNGFYRNRVWGWIKLMCLRIQTNVGCSEHNNEIYTKSGYFLSW
jgi:hypothetical protein